MHKSLQSLGYQMTILPKIFSLNDDVAICVVKVSLQSDSS